MGATQGLLHLVSLGAAFMAPPRVKSGPHAATFIGRYAITRTAALVMETTEFAAAADPYNKSEALQMPTTFESYQERAAAGEIVTGLLYVDPNPRDMHGYLKTVDVPLNVLDEAALIPGSAALDRLNASLR